MANLMNPETWVAVALYSIPMIISPGPGNAVLAASGAKFGVKGTLPFWIGFELSNLVWCLVYGLGLSTLLATNPTFSTALKWMGVAYTLYLAYAFFRSTSMTEQADVTRLTLIDGFLSVSLNPKIHQMILVMFSQFLNPEIALMVQVPQITAIFLLMCVICHSPWIVGGKILFSSFKSDFARKSVGYFFGVCMVLSAVFVAFSF